MFTRFSRSWALIKASGAVLRQDKELLLFPFFSAIATLLVSASFIVPLILTGAFERMDQGSEVPYMVLPSCSTWSSTSSSSSSTRRWSARP